MPSVFSLDNSIAEPPRKVAKINQSERPGLYFKIIAKYCLKIDFTPEKARNVYIIQYYCVNKIDKTQPTCVCFIQSTGTSNGERGFGGLWYPSLGWHYEKHWIIKTAAFWDENYVCQYEGKPWIATDYNGYNLPPFPNRAPSSFVSFCPTNDLLNYFRYLPHLLISCKLTPDIFIDNGIKLDMTNVIQLEESALLVVAIPDDIRCAGVTCTNPSREALLDFSTHEKFVAIVDKAHSVGDYDILENYVKPYENYVGGLLNAELKSHSCLRFKAPLTFGQSLLDILTWCGSLIDDINSYFRPVAPAVFSIGPIKKTPSRKGGKSLCKTRKRRRTKKRAIS
jgi:hypothetical protein